jgi:hypothetical protein
MRVLSLLVFLCYSMALFANTSITSQIYDIDYGQRIDDEILVLLKNGQVVKITHEMKELIENARYDELVLANQSLAFTVNKYRYITAIRPSDVKDVPIDESLFHIAQNKNAYIPTTIADLKVAQQYHREGRRNPKDSQCFNRAMIWSYEWWRNHSLRSMKILVFFTRNYIRRYNFEWWFHIAPYVHVKDEEGKVTEKVMDLKYTSGPRSFRQWTDIFMRNDAECPVITKYSEYADYPYTGECYLMRTNMYTYQPADLQMNEAWGYTKAGFNSNEVKAAYLEAFDINL